MKRPLVYAAAVTVCGTVCGIRETPGAARLIFITLIILLFLYYGKTDFSSLRNSLYGCVGKLGKRNRKADCRLYISTVYIRIKNFLKQNNLLVIISILLFSISFFRGTYISHKYNRTENAEFFEKYRARNPGQFDYALYLKSEGVYDVPSYKKYKERKNSTELTADDGIAKKVRIGLSEILDEELTERDAGIYKAVLLGDKAGLDSKLNRLYRKSGISHLLAVSGLHVGIIGLGIFKLLTGMLHIRNGTASLIASVSALMYMQLYGVSGSVLRAVIMLISAFAAKNCGRSCCIRSALGTAAIIAVLRRPYTVFTAGFQLSFGAVIGIAYTGELLSKTAERYFYLIKSSKISEEHSYLNKCREDMCRETKYTVKNRNRLCENAKSSNLPPIAKNSSLPPILKTAAAGVGVQLTILPITAWHYFEFPVYGIILNLIVIPMMSVVIYSGVAVLISGYAVRILLTLTAERLPYSAAKYAEYLPKLAAAPGHYVLRFYERICGIFVRLPYSSVCIGRPGIIQIFIYYAILFIMLYYFAYGAYSGKATSLIYNKYTKFVSKSTVLSFCYNIRLRAAGKIILLTALLIADSCLIKYRDRRDFCVSVLDVGQGDCFIIKKGKYHILIDGGSSSDKNIGQRVIEPYLLSKGVTGIDIAVVSHSDEDHVNGLKYILNESESIDIKMLAFPAAAGHNEKYDELKKAFLSRNFGNRGRSKENETAGEDNIVYLRSLMPIIKSRNMKLTCVYAGNDTKSDEPNRDSDVLLLESGEAFSMLFTGDMPKEEEQNFLKCYSELKSAALYENRALSGNAALYKNGTLYGNGISDNEKTPGSKTKAETNITVLKAAHHGSKTSSSKEFLEALKPKYAVLSFGKDNRYGHPSKEVTERMEDMGIGLLETGGGGAFYINEKGIFSEK